MIKSVEKNHEFRAVCLSWRKEIERMLKYEYKAAYQGTYHYVDTYFNTTHGQLKIREPKKGTSHLIQYYHSNNPLARTMTIQSQLYDNKSNLKEILTESLGIKAIVIKKRRTYTVDNLTFHIDYVKDLGIYLEMKAETEDPEIEVRNLRFQCLSYQKRFGIPDNYVTSESYSDLLLKAQAAKMITDFQAGVLVL